MSTSVDGSRYGPGSGSSSRCYGPRGICSFCGLRPRAADKILLWGMACWQVSPRVGSAKHNDPCLIGPIAFALDAS
jgi:hypothetical protein